jgi:hypothetical protein
MFVITQVKRSDRVPSHFRQAFGTSAHAGSLVLSALAA